MDTYVLLSQKLRKSNDEDFNSAWDNLWATYTTEQKKEFLLSHCKHQIEHNANPDTARLFIDKINTIEEQKRRNKNKQQNPLEVGKESENIPINLESICYNNIGIVSSFLTFHEKCKFEITSSRIFGKGKTKSHKNEYNLHLSLPPTDQFSFPHEHIISLFCSAYRLR